jgi:hypothetical protein
MEFTVSLCPNGQGLCRCGLCFSKVWWHYATLFNIYYFYNTIIHSLPKPFLYLHRFSAQQEKPPQGAAEPRIELGPALQQADALRTELRYTLRVRGSMFIVYTAREG